MAIGDRIPIGDNTLINMFSFAGGVFPFCNSTDITISTNTTWNDAIGYKKVRKLTINAGITLTIAKSPFIIFADEINFASTTSSIDASGLGGTQTTYPQITARGGFVTSGTALAQGGCGGGMLFIICGRFTGAQGKIKANGGNGFINNNNAASDIFGNGQGALSTAYNTTSSAESFNITIPTGSSTVTQTTTVFSSLNLLGNGGGGNAKGGGSGRINTDSGASGIGGGGGTRDGATTGAGALPNITPTFLQLYNLYLMGCIGGGGGGAYVSTTGANNSAGGGGGGAIIIFSRTYSITPAVEVNGGTGMSSGSNVAGNGAAGQYYILTV